MLNLEMLLRKQYLKTSIIIYICLGAGDWSMNRQKLEENRHHSWEKMVKILMRIHCDIQAGLIRLQRTLTQSRDLELNQTRHSEMEA